MNGREIVVKIPVPAAKALLIYGLKLADMNSQCEPEVSKGLGKATCNIWEALTQAGEIDELNHSIAKNFLKNELDKP